MSTARDELYIGYLERAPAQLARWIRERVLVLVALIAIVGLVLTLLQAPFARASFEFGSLTPHTGRIELTPVPTLVVARPASSETSRFLLVAPGKHGAAELLAPFDGRVVELTGILVYREDATLLELDPASVRLKEDVETTPEAGAPVPLGERTLEGEIVDSKCFLGVMKPGELKPHRACASLCIRGGIPPVLCVRDASGLASYWVLVSPSGAPVNLEVLPFVAEPVRVTGEALRYGELHVLRADPARIVRL